MSMPKSKSQKTAAQVAAEFVSHVTVKTLDGDKAYTFTLLKRREAAEVYYGSLAVVLKSVLSLIGDRTNPGALVDLIEFDRLWGLGEKLLKHACVDGVAIDYESYYGENPDELVFAVAYAVHANFPRVFSKVRDRLNALDLTGLLNKAVQSGILNTASAQELLKSAKLQDSTE